MGSIMASLDTVDVPKSDKHLDGHSHLNSHRKHEMWVLRIFEICASKFQNERIISILIEINRMDVILWMVFCPFFFMTILKRHLHKCYFQTWKCTLSPCLLTFKRTSLTPRLLVVFRRVFHCSCIGRNVGFNNYEGSWIFCRWIQWVEFQDLKPIKK